MTAMTQTTKSSDSLTESPRSPRQYDSPLRRQQAADTRDSIIVAGCEILQNSSVRDWRALTIRGVARRAGVNERTVYRYFVNERGLHDAVMRRREQQAGIDLAGMGLDDIAEVAARIFAQVASYPIAPKPPLDPTLTEAAQRQRDSLRDAVAEWTTEWPPSEQAAAAAMFDVLWSVATFERLVVDWQVERDQAIRTITWAISLIQDAVRQGRRPGHDPRALAEGRPSE
jgi:AcrR family transcriptional regulator